MSSLFVILILTFLKIYDIIYIENKEMVCFQMAMIKTDLGNYLPVNEWLKYYADLLRNAGYPEEQVDFRVDLKKG